MVVYRRARKYLVLTLLVLSSLLATLSLSSAAVIVFDTVALVNKPVMLRAQTKGVVLPRGGQMVDIYVEEKKVGNTLSGGDGYAFFEYTPKTQGLKKVRVGSTEDHGTGMLLVVKKKEKGILIEVEGGIVESMFSNNYSITWYVA